MQRNSQAIALTTVHIKIFKSQDITKRTFKHFPLANHVYCLFNGLKIKEQREFDGKHRKSSKLQARTKLTTLRVLDQTFLSLSYWNPLASKVKSTEVPFLIHFMCLSGSKTWYSSRPEWNSYSYFSK